MSTEPKYAVCWVPERYAWEAKRSDLPALIASGDSPAEALTALQTAIGEPAPDA